MKIPTYEEVYAHKSGPYPVAKYYPEFYQYLQTTYPGKKLPEQIWLYFFKTQGTCKICGNPTEFISIRKGYQRYCCRKCASKGGREERIKTCLSRYGTTNGGWTESAQTKIKQTCQEKWRSDSPFGSKELQDKVKQINQKRYGINYPLESKEIRDRYAQICLEKYGTKTPFSIPGVQEKIKSSNLKKYGVEYPLESAAIRDKGVQTCIERYGVPYSFLDPNANPGYSKISQEYFKSLDEQYPNAVYATKGGEQRAGPYLLDWYDPDSNAVIEFNGDYWHANPKLYSPDWVHPIKKCTAKELWEHDKVKIDYLKSLGYNVKIIWESDVK